MIAGFYHDPPLWVATPPTDLDAYNLEQIREEVARFAIGGFIDVSVRREGLFIFDLSKWPLTRIDLQGGREMFHSVERRTVEATRLLNAYLAFLYTHELEIDHFARRCMVVTPETMALTHSLDADAALSADIRSVHLQMSSYSATYLSSVPILFDNRIFLRQGVLSVKVVEAAAKSLSALLSDHSDMGIQLCDIYVRSTRAYQEHNHSLSLILSWTIIERMLGEMWAKYMADNKERDGTPFISGNRAKRFKDTRSYTASVKSEVLSLVNVLPSDILAPMSEVRGKRNNWMHELDDTITHEDAIKAMETAEAMLQLVRGIHLVGNRTRQLSFRSEPESSS